MPKKDEAVEMLEDVLEAKDVFKAAFDKEGTPDQVLELYELMVDADADPEELVADLKTCQKVTTGVFNISTPEQAMKLFYIRYVGEDD
jgi:hypothetical protein